MIRFKYIYISIIMLTNDMLCYILICNKIKLLIKTEKFLKNWNFVAKRKEIDEGGIDQRKIKLFLIFKQLSDIYIYI